MMKHAFLAAAGTLMVATATNAALIRPAGMTNLYDWNFDGDGAAAGTVDSGSSATDWVGNNVESLKSAGWAVNTAADSDTGFYVSPTTFGGHLAINDLTAETPEAVLGFGADRLSGFMEVEAGVAGNQNQQGVISLRDGTTELARINITNQTTGSFVSGNGSTDIADSSWNFNYRLHQVAWSVNADGTDGTVSYFFDATGTGTDVTIVDAPFIVNGVPDRLALRVGFNSSTVDRRMLISGLTVAAAVPEPASLGALVLAGGLLMARRRRG